MRNVGEASDDGQLCCIPAGCLPNTTLMIIGLKLIRRALCTAVVEGNDKKESAYFDQGLQRQDISGTTKYKKALLLVLS